MARSLSLLFVCILHAGAIASALYTSKDGIVELTPGNFDKEVIQYKGVAVVEFYAPWCGHCKNLAPVYKQIAEKLKGLALVGAVNCDEDKNKRLCAAQGIQGFPTVKLFPAEQEKNPYTGKLGKTPESLPGQATLRSVNDAVTKLYTDLHVKRPSNEKEYDAWSAETADLPKVVLFTSKSSTTVLYKSLSTQFRQRLAFAEVHESKEELVKKFGITDFPTLLVSKGVEQHPYSGKMNAQAIKTFLEQYALPVEAVKEEEKPQESSSSSNSQQVQVPPVPIESLSLDNLTDIDAKEPLWLIAFTVGTAESCASQLKEFNTTIQDMQGVVKVGQLLLTSEEVSEHKSTLRDHGVDVTALDETCDLQIVRFPFGEDKQESEEFATYKGRLDGKALQQFATEGIPNLAQDITNLENFLARPRTDGKQGFAPKVILVTNKDEAPGVYRALAANLASTTTMVFGYVRASDPANADIVKRVGLQKIPGMTVAGLMAGDGPGSDGGVKLGFQPYHGALKYSHMYMFLNVVAQMVGASTEVPDSAAASSSRVAALESDTALKELCMDKPGLCVMGLLDSRQDTKQQVEVLEAVARKREGQPLQFGWVDAATQPTFAAALEVTGTAALPSVVAISTRKQRLATLVGSYDADNVHRWLDSVLLGRVATVPLQAVPKLVEGGEAAAPLSSPPEEALEVVEEMDLSEILGEEIEGALGTKADLLEKVEEEIKAEEAAKAAEGKKKKKKSKKKKKKSAPSQPKEEL